MISANFFQGENMGKCHVSLDEIRINVENQAATHAYVLVRMRGDCPLDMTGWYHKTFPVTLPTSEVYRLIVSGDESPLTAEHWTRRRPPVERPGDLPAPVFGSRTAEALQTLVRFVEAWAADGKPPAYLSHAMMNAVGALDEARAFDVTDRATLAILLEQCAANMYRPGEPRPQDAGYRLLGVLDGYIEQVAKRGGTLQ